MRYQAQEDRQHYRHGNESVPGHLLVNNDNRKDDTRQSARPEPTEKQPGPHALAAARERQVDREHSNDGALVEIIDTCALTGTFWTWAGVATDQPVEMVITDTTDGTDYTISGTTAGELILTNTAGTSQTLTGVNDGAQTVTFSTFDFQFGASLFF